MTSFTDDKKNYASGNTTVSERLEQFLQRCRERDDLRAFVYVDAEGSMRSAVESDERISSGLARPLEGLVVAMKDNISVQKMPLTCASNMLKDFGPVYDATVAERLRDAGALFIGKTNMDEFAMGSSNENSAFGRAKHPIDPDRVPGGSSGGSAIAVADGQCHVALGSDTGGSVRQPAAFCGVYGMKPTYGRVSRYGLVAFASSLDQIGIFANEVDDLASTFDVITGHDPMDATSHEKAAGDAWTALESPLPKPLRVGIISGDLLDGCDESIREGYAKFIEKLRSIGAEITEISIPNHEIWVPTYFILAAAEASSNLARFDGVRYGHRKGVREYGSTGVREYGSTGVTGDMTTLSRTEGFGMEVKRRIMLGTYVLSSGYYEAYYKSAQKARRLISDAYTEIFKSVDVVAMPTTPTTAFVHGEITDPVQMWLSDLYTVSANIAGIPALSVPFGEDAKGLPIGMQLQAKMFDDELLIRVAKELA